ncbi:MAG: copper resistance protein NlpE [Weeksellaceae bacterium]|jgi:uncharacterized lipoprotein NlpE involved in copper resistance|nr:copper resistance protein NlpE [Weeksellaceae bacterium]
MYKSLLLTAFAVLFMTNCNSTKEESLTRPEADTTVDETAPDMHNAQNSLDYTGVYKGILPCADCEGIDTEITLNPDETYETKYIYLGKDNKVFEDIGSYEWLEDGTRIILENVDSGTEYYFVAENQLIKLDMQGNKITGPNEKNYVLTKQ